MVPFCVSLLLQLVERCPFAVCFISALDKSCSLHQLVHYQQKLQQLQQHVLQGTTLAARDAMCYCPSLVKVPARDRAPPLLARFSPVCSGAGSMHACLAQASASHVRVQSRSHSCTRGCLLVLVLLLPAGAALV